MTKKEIYNEIYRQIYEVRFYMGFYCEGSKAYTPERAERFAVGMAETEAQSRVLFDLTDKLRINPVFKNWYIEAFNIGFKANTVGECIIPDNLVDKD